MQKSQLEKTREASYTSPRKTMNLLEIQKKIAQDPSLKGRGIVLTEQMKQVRNKLKKAKDALPPAVMTEREFFLQCPPETRGEEARRLLKEGAY